MKKMLPAAIIMTLAACSKKDAQENPPPAAPVWNLTEIAGSGQSTFFHYSTTAGEPFAWVSRSAEGPDSTAVSWNGGKPQFTWLFFNSQKRIDRSFHFSGNQLARIQYHNFNHSGQWTVTDYDSLVYENNHLSELHVINGGARNQMYKLFWDGNNLTRSESYDVQGEIKILTETTAYVYNDQPGISRSFKPWFYFIYTQHQFSALSDNELTREERISASGTLRWRNTYHPAYFNNGRLEKLTRFREDFTIPATENTIMNYIYQSNQ